MRVRSARAADEANVVALWAACGLITSGNDPVADFRFALSGPASSILLAEHDGDLAASAMVGHDGHRGWIYYLATSPSHRLQGYGRKMVETSEAWMAERGVPKSQLMIRDTNTDVVAFYERLGYGVIPRLTMQKILPPPR